MSHHVKLCAPDITCMARTEGSYSAGGTAGKWWLVVSAIVPAPAATTGAGINFVFPAYCRCSVHVLIMQVLYLLG